MAARASPSAASASALRPLDDVPTIAAVATAAVGLVDLLSAVTPNVRWRGRELAPPRARLGDAERPCARGAGIAGADRHRLLPLPSSCRGRCHLAVALLCALDRLRPAEGARPRGGGSHGRLRGSARGEPRRRSRRSTSPGTLPLGAGCACRCSPLATFATAFVVVAVAAPSGVSTAAAIRETGDLLLWQAGPFGFHDELARTGLAVELISILAVLTAAYILFRPLAAPRDLPDPELRHAAARIVEEHGTDTLSFFKLRGDKHYLFDPRAHGVPRLPRRERRARDLGRPGRRAGRRRERRALGGRRSPRSARCGSRRSASARRAGRVFEQAGLRALYLGDEAIVDTARVLARRARRSARCASR